MNNEQFIITDINERELLRSLARAGVKTFNVRVFSAVGFAREMLLRSGKTVAKKEMSALQQQLLIRKIAAGNSYFGNCTLNDCINIHNAISTARTLCRGNEEEKLEDVLNKGEFVEKNRALLQVYREYKKYLNDNSLTDSIEIINEALKCCGNTAGQFITFTETPLKPLEEELVKKVSDNCYESLSIRAFANVKDKPLSDVTYANGYGAVNEVEYILSYIAENRIAYDDCLLVLIDESYLSHIVSYGSMYGISLTSALGWDVSASNPFKVLSLIDKWEKGYHHIDCLNQLINAEEFDREKFWNNISVKLDDKKKKELITAAGNLKLTVEYDQNRMDRYRNTSDPDYDMVNRMAEEFGKGYSYLVSTYTRIRENTIDERALKTITSFIDETINEITLSDMISYLGRKKVNRQLSKPGSIHISDLKSALGCIRKHVFIAGLNGKVFPGSPKEDYLLLDSDLKSFNEDLSIDSKKKVKNNQQLLLDLIDNISAFDGKLHLSYSGYSLSDLKTENPSSMLFEILKKEEEKANKDLLEQKLGSQHIYFSKPVSSLKEMGEKYLEGFDIAESKEDEEETSSAVFNRAISPSGADIFYSCPKRFYLKYCLGISEVEENDPFAIFPANDEGTLIHECMEDYGNNKGWSEAQFMNNASEKLENYFCSHVPLHDKSLESTKRTFLQMALTGYRTDKGNAVFASERYVSCIDPVTGLKFGGIIDRIEKVGNKYIIVDYKTYKDIRNEEDDVDTCFQVLLYAYILENKGYEVDHCEYRYLRNPRIITCRYDETMKKELIIKLEQIKQAIDSGVFELAEKDDRDEVCRYCTFNHICGREKEEQSN